jgi:hypothetical protein
MMDHAHPGQGRLPQGVAAVGGEPRADGHDDLALAAVERPALLQRRAREAEAGMPGEVARVTRPAVPLQVGGRRAGDQVEGAQAPRDQAVIVQRAGAEHTIVALVREVDDAVAQGEANRYLGVLGHVLGKQRRKAVGAERDRRVDPQLAPRPRPAVGRDGLGRLQFREHDARPFEEVAPGVGQALPAGRPVQQAHAQVLLQLPDVLADHRRGDVGGVRGRRERAEVGDLGEHLHAGETVHIPDHWLRVSLSNHDLSRIGRVPYLPSRPAAPARERGEQS